MKAPQTPEETTLEFKQTLQANSITFTENRRIVAQILITSTDHLDINQIYNQAREVNNKISMATVYRAVNTFVTLGLVERLEFGEGKYRYEVLDSWHDHIIESDTGHIIEFSSDIINQELQKIAEQNGYKINKKSLKLYCTKVTKVED